MHSFLEKIRNNSTDPSAERWRQALVILLSYAGLLPIFRGYFFRPNSLSYAFGGDAFVLYYDMVYHVRYGHGTTLTGMNYPFGEYIFLTDAQGALAMLLQWFSHHFFDVSSYAVGIIHAVNLYLLPLCSLFVYHLLKSLGVRPFISILFGILICIMSPQVMRLAGHFGLAYPFLIPMAMLWFARKYRLHGKMEWRDLAFLFTLLFFTYNNPYAGVSATGVMVGAGAMLLANAIFRSEKNQMRTGIIAICAGVLAVAIPFLDFRLNDPVSDRIVQQFGFFGFNASLDGMLFPPGSLLNHLMRIFGMPYQREINFESRMNLGLIASLLFTALALRGVFGRFWAKKFRYRIPQVLLPSWWKMLLASSLFMYLLAANYSLYGWAKDWMEAHLGLLLMFKASGRLGWSFYYTATISAVVFLDFLLRKMRRISLSNWLALLLILVWCLEFNLYTGVRYREVFFENNFDERHEAELKQQLKKVGFRAEDYIAMLSIPRLVSWSDHFRNEMNWATQFYSLRISAATGLPMLNAMLSRIGTTDAAEATQFASHPIIERERLRKLPIRRKYILLVLGSDQSSPTEGEEALISAAEPVFEDKVFSLYRIGIDDFEALQKSYETIAQQDRLSATPCTDCLHLSFEGQATPHHFYGNGALQIPNGKSQITAWKLPKITPDTVFTFSAWHWLDPAHYDMGRWTFTLLDSTGQIVETKNLETITGYDVQHGWLRLETDFHAVQGGTIRLEVDCRRPLWIDEILIRPKGRTDVYELPEQQGFLWNGYWVEK